MKCDTCEQKKHHSPGSFYAVAECGDDPYDYEYCGKDHWCGGPEPQTEEQYIFSQLHQKVDVWENCPDYEKKL